MAKRFGKACLVGGVWLASHAVQAQMISPMLYEGPRISLQDHADRNRPSSSPDGATRPSPGQGSAAGTPDPAIFGFAPSPERRAANLAHFVAVSRSTNRQSGDSLAALFAQGDIIERMRPELAKHALAIDNVADAYTLWWITAWQASRGVDEDVGNATTAAVRQQVMRSMDATGQLRTADDAAKQEMAESLLIQSLLLSAAVDQAKVKPDEKEAVGRAAAQGALGMGIDLSTMTLTEKGFVPSEQPD